MGAHKKTEKNFVIILALICLVFYSKVGIKSLKNNACCSTARYLALKIL